MPGRDRTLPFGAVLGRRGRGRAVAGRRGRDGWRADRLALGLVRRRGSQGRTGHLDTASVRYRWPPYHLLRWRGQHRLCPDPDRDRVWRRRAGTDQGSLVRGQGARQGRAPTRSLASAFRPAAAEIVGSGDLDGSQYRRTAVDGRHRQPGGLVAAPAGTAVQAVPGQPAVALLPGAAAAAFASIIARYTLFHRASGTDVRFLVGIALFHGLWHLVWQYAARGAAKKADAAHVKP